MALAAMTPFLWSAAWAETATRPAVAPIFPLLQLPQVNQIIEQTVTINIADTPYFIDDNPAQDLNVTPTPSSCPPSNLLEAGRASWYGPGFHRKRTANGERFDMNTLSAAHRTLPLGMQVRVRNPATGQTVQVRVNDRGPYKNGVILDLARAAARAIGLDRQGLMAVEVLSLDEGEDSGAC